MAETYLSQKAQDEFWQEFGGRPDMGDGKDAPFVPAKKIRVNEDKSSPNYQLQKIRDALRTREKTLAKLEKGQRVRTKKTIPEYKKEIAELEKQLGEVKKCRYLSS